MRKNITLSLDEDVLERFQNLARKRGTTANALVREYIISEVEAKEKLTLEEGFRLADELNISLKGWKWNREEVYDRKGIR